MIAMRFALVLVAFLLGTTSCYKLAIASAAPVVEEFQIIFDAEAVGGDLRHEYTFLVSGLRFNSQVQLPVEKGRRCQLVPR